MKTFTPGKRRLGEERRWAVKEGGRTRGTKQGTRTPHKPFEQAHTRAQNKKKNGL